MLTTGPDRTLNKNIAMNWNQIGEQIKAKRKKKGMSQDDLGDKIGSTKQFISQLENGYPCSVKLLNKIADALECELDVRFKDK